MDPMQDYIKGFAAQLEQGWHIGQQAVLPPAKAPIHRVVLLGLGGSAFGGELTRNLMEAEGRVPITIHRGYSAPAWVDAHTLVIASSYSGNTEETLQSLHEAHQKGGQVVCITSGGQVQQFAERHGLPLIVIPGGQPPRTACGFSFVQQLVLLGHYGLLPDQGPQLRAAIERISSFSDHELARVVAEQLQDRLPIIYSSDAVDSIAIRLRQQVNENSKQLCWHHVLPEMNHNELVGWELPRWLHDRCTVVWLRSRYEHPRTTLRFGINAEVIGRYTRQFVEIAPRGDSRVEELLYLLHFCDWVSLYLAELNAVDPTPVKVIDYLKNELSAR
jgi:glucose/mannose-6-phosphate isomerase